MDIGRKINIKYFTVAYLGLLLVFSSLYARAPTYLMAGALIAALYSFFDLAWTRMRDHVWYLPVSSWISAMVLSVVALTNPSILQVIALPFLAVLSKQLFRFGKTRHVWNPAAFSMAVFNLFIPAISWWAVSLGTLPIIVVSVVGSFILWRQQRWHIALSFLGSFALLSVMFSVLRGSQSSTVFETLPRFLFSGPVIFFSTVMVIEPLTSSFSTYRRRTAYGFLVGFFAAGVSAVSRLIPQMNLDPLIAGLLLGNLSACLLFLPSRKADPSLSPTH